MPQIEASLPATIHWQIAPAFQEHVPDGVLLDDWLRAGQAQVVKHGPHRTVYHVCLPGINFYLKHNRVHDARAWLRQLVRPSKARLEHDKACAIAQRGIPTVTPIGIGETVGRTPGDSFLLTLGLDDTEPLSTFFEKSFHQINQSRRIALQRRLAVALGRFLARMHDAGVTHNDLHAGNFLIRLAPDDRPELFLLDVHAVQVGADLGWEESRANLIMLNRWFAMRVTRSDRLRFWRAYCRERGGHSDEQQRLDEDNQAIDLEKATLASNLDFWRGRDQRCLENNRYYHIVRAPGIQGHAVRDLDEHVLSKLLADPDAPFAWPGVRVLKASRSSTVAELEIEVDGQKRQVIYKRFRNSVWRRPLRNLMRRSAAVRSWIFGQGLRERGLPTARPLAVLQRRRGGLTGDCYLLTEKIPDGVDLGGFLNRLTSPTERRRLIEQIARLVRALHQCNLSQRDLKSANILVSPAHCPWSLLRPQGQHEAWLIDLVGVTLHQHLSRQRRMQNLARLNASFWANPRLTRTDKLRFLRVYLQWGISGRMGWKRWWRGVEAMTLAKIARNQANGRPLA